MSGFKLNNGHTIKEDFIHYCAKIFAHFEITYTNAHVARY